MHSHTQRQHCLYHRNLFLAPTLELQLPPLVRNLIFMCVSERRLKYGRRLNISSRVPENTGVTTGDHTYNWTTDAHTLSLEGEFTTQISRLHANTHRHTSIQLRRKLLRQQSQCVRACVFTFEYEVNSGCHWEDQSHPARTGNHETT